VSFSTLHHLAAPSQSLELHEKLLDSFRPFGRGSKSLVGTAPKALIQADAFGRVTEWNAKATTLLGWRREEVIGKRLCDTLFRWRDNSVWTALSHLADAAPGPRRSLDTELRAYRDNGETVDLEVTLWASRDHGAARTNVFIHDLTGRKPCERTRSLIATEHQRRPLRGAGRYGNNMPVTL
jgi:PAS domain S-box-containing protein